jgi:hypothetical protein
MAKKIELNLFVCCVVKGDDNSVICRLSYMTAYQHYTPIAARPSLIVESNPVIGISDTTMYQYNTWVTCGFTREATNSSVTNYFNLNGSTEYYILAAFGNVRSGENIF